VAYVGSWLQTFRLNLYSHDKKNSSWMSAPRYFLKGPGGGGADPETVYNLCLILKIVIKTIS